MENESNEVENYPLSESLNQMSYLGDILRRLMPEYSDYHDGRIHFFTATLTYKQYRRLLAMYFNKQHADIVAECKPQIEIMPKE